MAPGAVSKDDADFISLTDGDEAAQGVEFHSLTSIPLWQGEPSDKKFNDG